MSHRYTHTSISRYTLSYVIINERLFGVVLNRTGSGKSSIMMALFRIIELSHGRIFIGGTDIATLPLQAVRSYLAIIPQDPVLFTGNIRFQLDPFEQFSDAEVWDVLEKVNLAAFIRSFPEGLDEMVKENGENLSQGQRQLLCIARALLKRVRVLIVDEGTSAVDPFTDELIQKVLREQVVKYGCTILAIAHRLQTIIDFDRILVLSEGCVVEFDTPQNLTAREDSVFYSRRTDYLTSSTHLVFCVYYYYS